jgi:hypothetical protein
MLKRLCPHARSAQKRVTSQRLVTDKSHLCEYSTGQVGKGANHDHFPQAT